MDDFVVGKAIGRTEMGSHSRTFRSMMPLVVSLANHALRQAQGERKISDKSSGVIRDVTEKKISTEGTS